MGNSIQKSKSENSTHNKTDLRSDHEMTVGSQNESSPFKKTKKHKANTTLPCILYLDDYGFKREVGGRQWNLSIITNLDNNTFKWLHQFDNNTISSDDAKINVFSFLTVGNLVELVIQGIPFDYRKQLWQLCAQIDKIKEIHSTNNNNISSFDYYNSLASNLNCKGYDTILADVNRTFANHEFFKIDQTKLSLERVLIALSNYDPLIGYCQGINFMAGLLLFHFEEEDCFWMLVSLMRQFKLTCFYYDNMSQLRRSVE